MTEFLVTLRGLARTPVLSAAAILTIALAIGGATAVFALLESVVLRALPYEQPDELVAVWVDYSGRAEEMGLQDPKREWTNVDNFSDVREQSQTLEGLSLWTRYFPSFRAGDGVQRIEAAGVSWDGLALLGVRPVVGRLFVEREGAADAPCTVVLSHGFWQRHFAGDASVVGQDLSFTGETCTVVGVAEAGFRFPFVPGAEIMSPMRSAGNDRGAAYLRQFGRLADGATLEQAQAELDTIATNLRDGYPDVNRGLGLFVEPMKDAMSLGVREQIVLLQIAALFVLVIATANLASLMVARAIGRAGEFGVRAALGAGRWQRFRLLWLEGLALGVAGAALGVLAAAWGVEMLARAFPPSVAQTWDIGIGVSTVTVAFGFALLAGTVIALVSYTTLARTAMAGAGAGKLAGTRGGARISATLIASNFAVALAVAVTGTLLLQSYQRLSQVDPGYRAEGVLAGMIALPSQLYSPNYPNAEALFGAYDRLLEYARAIPGVSSVGLASAVPFGVSNNDTGVLIEGHRTTRPDGRAHVWLSRVTPGYLETMGIGVSEGRAFEDTDRVDGRNAVVVNSAFVREYLGGRSPLGLRIGTGPDDSPIWFDIVGVADDVRTFDLASEQTPSLYLPAWVSASRGMYITLRSERDAAALAADLRRAVTLFDPDLALTDVQSMGERIDAQLMVPRTVSRLTLLFALCALLLAAVGVYGTLAQSVLQRTREIGVRRALGATDRAVFSLVLRQGALPVAIGLAAGIPLAAVLSRRLESILYTVAATDPRAWIIAFAALFAVAFVAALLPGRRAVRVPPMEALRDE